MKFGKGVRRLALSGEKLKALETALAQIEKQCGKGSIMRLGENQKMEVKGVSTGSLSLDMALGIGGVPRGRIIEIYGPESSGKTTVALHIIGEVQKAGVPVVVIDSQVSNPDLVACTIASDNYGAGVLCAEHLMNTCNSAKVVLIEHASTKSGMDRIQGFCDTLASHPDFQIIGRADSAGQLEVAMPQMDRLLEQGIVPDAVMCLNDPSALGAMAALQEHGLLEKTTVYGVDGAPEAKSMISEGAMTATAAQSPIRLGQITAQTVYAILNGEDYEKEITVPVGLVTKDNVNGYDMDGWQ